LVAASANKTIYFQRLKSYTKLTSREYDGSQKMKLPSALFLGDSITRELFTRYQAVSPDTKTDWLPRGQAMPTFENDETVAWEPTLLLNEKNLSEMEHRVVFVGGNALHMAKRTWTTLSNWRPPFNFSTHEHRVRGLLAHLRHLKTPKRQVVYIGSLNVDLQLLLPPAKHDWVTEMYDFGYLDIWAEIDRRLCAEYGLLFFDHMELVRRCPGVRCDGMHFGSRFTQWQCCSSKHLLDRLLIGFAKKHFL
jgi:hypothetical protein